MLSENIVAIIEMESESQKIKEKEYFGTWAGPICYSDRFITPLLPSPSYSSILKENSSTLCLIVRPYGKSTVVTVKEGFRME